MPALLLSQLCGNLDSRLGCEVQLRGRLLVSNQSFLAVDRAACIRGECILIQDGGALRAALLRSAVPPHGGGKFIYNEDAELGGKLARGSCGFELHGPFSCTVHVEGRALRII